MKKTVVISLFSLFIVCFSEKSYSQDNIGEFFKSGPEDATKLVNAYMSPFFKGIGSGLNGGWTNTARSKKKFQFDLRFSASLASIPNSDKSYDVDDLQLKNIRPVDPHKTVGPTFFGEKTEGPEMELYSNGFSTGSIRLPKGVISYAPAPQLQLTVGLPGNIDVFFRYVPSAKIDEGKLDVFGIGGKLEILPIFLPKGKSAPIDVAVAVAYSKVNYNFPLDYNNTTISDQKIETEIKGLSTDLIVSKKIGFFTPFISVGQHQSKSSLNALGTYYVDAPTPLDPNYQEVYRDPVKLNNTDIDGLRTSLGFQLNLSILKVYTSYTLAQYNYLNVGLGIGWGK